MAGVSASSARPGHEACSGCSLCLLACPLWQATRDIRLSPQGRAKALQHGASAADLSASVDACTLCGACEPACPEDIALVDGVLGLRRELAHADPNRVSTSRSELAQRAAGEFKARVSGRLLVGGRTLAAHPGILQKTLALFGGTLALATDDGADIALALEAGAVIPQARLQTFAASLRAAPGLVVADGVLLRALRDWLPGNAMLSLGEAVTRREEVRRGLHAGDFYVIEPRAYHADRARLVGHYDDLRRATGCTLNWDLQRLAIPTTASSLASSVDARAQARWMLQGHCVGRIVVEDPADIAVFSEVSSKPVLHVSELTET